MEWFGIGNPVKAGHGAPVTLIAYITPLKPVSGNEDATYYKNKPSPSNRETLET